MTQTKAKKTARPVEVEAFVNLLMTHEALSGEFDLLFKRHGLTHAQYNVLRILRGAGERVSVQYIAEHIISRKPDVTRLVDRLVAQNLATRTRCTEDRRVVWVKITAKGTKQLAALDAPVAKLHHAQLGHMSNNDLKTLAALLVRAREAV